MLLLAACGREVVVPLPPHPASVEVAVVRRDEVTVGGEQCLWELETLRVDDSPLWTAEPPSEEAWCASGFETARIVDVVGRDGPFVSVYVSELDAVGVWTTRCMTWDVRTRTPATLDGWNVRLAPALWARVGTVLAEPAWQGWTTSREAFLLRGGHVSFCVARGGATAEIAVR